VGCDGKSVMIEWSLKIEWVVMICRVECDNRVASDGERSVMTE
jgi:hypothetical protein